MLETLAGSEVPETSEMRRHVESCTDLVIPTPFKRPHDDHNLIAPLQASKRALQVGSDLPAESFL
jgi:hypothetical protein